MDERGLNRENMVQHHTDTRSFFGLEGSSSGVLPGDGDVEADHRMDLITGAAAHGEAWIVDKARSLFREFDDSLIDPHKNLEPVRYTQEPDPQTGGPWS